MFDHVKFGVTDYAASRAFYLQALAPLGVAVVSEGAPAYGVELCGSAQYHASYYAAFVIGRDGHNLEAVCHAAEA